MPYKYLKYYSKWVIEYIFCVKFSISFVEITKNMVVKKEIRIQTCTKMHRLYLHRAFHGAPGK